MLRTASTPHAANRLAALAALVVLMVALPSCSRDSTRITHDGREYVRLEGHPSVRAAERVVGKLPSLDDLRSRFAETGEVCHSAGRRDFPHEADADLTGIGIIVPYGPSREDGGRSAHSEGAWIWGYSPPVEPGEFANVTIDFDVYVPDDWAIESTGSYVDGAPVGEWAFWHRNGALRARGSFEAGEMTGLWSFWTASGTPDDTLSGIYEAGTRTGD